MNAAAETDAGTGGDALCGSPNWREEEELQHELPSMRAMLTIGLSFDESRRRIQPSAPQVS